MTQRKFCFFPWKEAYINPLGNYGICPVENSNFNKDKISIDVPIQEHWNSQYMRDTRRAFINGDDLPQCQGCWTDENNNKTSMRQRRNHRYLSITDPEFDNEVIKQLVQNTTEDGRIEELPTAFNVSTGDTCQLRCIECSPTFSRSILKDYQKLGWDKSFKTRRDSATFSVVLDQVDIDQHVWEILRNSADSMEWLTLTGGEPTLSKPLVHFLKWLIEKNLAKNINILICTNAVNIKKEFTDVVSKFKSCVFSISVDAYGQLDEYIRYPTNWAKKEKIVSNLISLFPGSSIHQVVSSLNINQFDKMVDWALSNNYLLVPQILTSPDNLSFHHLPNDLKDHARSLLLSLNDKLDQHKLDNSNLYDQIGYLSKTIGGMLNHLEKPANTDVWQETVEIVKSYDRIRPAPLHTINPYFLKYTAK